MKRQKNQIFPMFFWSFSQLKLRQTLPLLAHNWPTTGSSSIITRPLLDHYSIRTPSELRQSSVKAPSELRQSSVKLRQNSAKAPSELDHYSTITRPSLVISILAFRLKADMSYLDHEDFHWLLLSSFLKAYGDVFL